MSRGRYKPLTDFYAQLGGEDPKDMCHEWSHDLAEEVPGLIHVAGYAVVEREDGRRERVMHHWCIREGTEQIVDPSAPQFRRTRGYRRIVSYDMQWVCPDHGEGATED